eukprot:768440-Hanusia_phi.AAC.10
MEPARSSTSAAKEESLRDLSERGRAVQPYSYSPPPQLPPRRKGTSQLSTRFTDSSNILKRSSLQKSRSLLRSCLGLWTVRTQSEDGVACDVAGQGSSPSTGLLLSCVALLLSVHGML